MIGYLVGKPVTQGKDLLIITGGVGYQVHVPASVLAGSGSLDTLELYIYTHVKEDCFELYGFRQTHEKEIFQLLLGVSGVGPRTALALSELGANQIIQAVQMADVAMLSNVPRVGKKVAQKIIIELTSKLGTLQELNLGLLDPVESDVKQALLSLGYGESEVHQVMAQLDFATQQNTSILVKQAIKLMSNPHP